MSWLRKGKGYWKKHKIDLLSLIAYLVLASLTYAVMNRPWGQVHSLALPIDYQIPLVKELVLVYHTYIPLLLLTGLLLQRENRRLFYRYLLALATARITAYLVYVFFCTRVPDYPLDQLPKDFYGLLLRLTLTIDQRYAALPSLHVCDMVVASSFLARTKLSPGKKGGLIAYMALIASTTVFIKQHVLLDLPAGLVHGLLASWLSGLLFPKLEKRWKNSPPSPEA